MLRFWGNTNLLEAGKGLIEAFRQLAYLTD